MKITEEMLYERAPEAEKIWLNSLPPDDQIPEYNFSRRFQRRMKKLILEQQYSESIRKTLHMVRQTAAVIFLIATLSFSCLMTVEAYRVKFIEVITEIFYDLTHFTFLSSWDNDLEFKGVELGYLPNGMNEIRREIFSDTQGQTIYFEDESGYQLKVNQNLITEDTDLNLILDTEAAEGVTVFFGEREGFLVEKGITSTLMWKEEPYLFILTGDLPSEEILKIAKEVTLLK